MNSTDKLNTESNNEGNGRKFKDDRIVNLINTKFTSLKEDDVRKNNEILHKILNQVLSTIKEKNDLFKEVYQRIVFVGSYYKGTKVGKPEEFDLNLVIQLPIDNETIKFESDVPGYTKLKLDASNYKPKWEDYSKILGKWVTPDGYLNQDLFRQFIESSFNNIPKVATVGNDNYELKCKKSGPAFTLYVTGPTSVEISVDLVPVLEFKTQPPVPGDFSAASWFVVPKTKRDLAESHLYWRMSFYDYEKPMMRKCGCLKPVVRQLKKLRDKEDWKIIASYYIETLILHRIKAMENTPELQKNSITEHFVDMLVKLKEACETNTIISFWDPSHNLIEDVKPEQLIGIKWRLEKMIKQITKDPFTIADHVLTKTERLSIEPELTSYRNSGKSAKIVNQETTKTNETKSIPSPSIPIDDSTAFGASAGFLRNILPLLPFSIPQELESLLSPGATQFTASSERDLTLTPPPSETDLLEEKEDPLPNNPEKSDGIQKIMKMLKSIQKDVAETKEAVKLVNRRVSFVEKKIDDFLSRSNAQETFLGSQYVENNGNFYLRDRLPRVQ